MSSLRFTASASLPSETLRAAFAMPVVASGKWNLLLPRGTFHGNNLKKLGGSLAVDDAFLGECVASWVSAGKPKLPVRKTHQHLDDDVDAVERLELERAYGFITDMRASPAGLECFVEWNPAGVDAVTSGEWAFWSAEWGKGSTNLLTGETVGWCIYGAALTNTPFFDNLPPLAASADAVNGGTNPKSKQRKTMEELLNQVKEMLSGDNGPAFGAALKSLIGAPDEEPITAETPTPPAPAPMPDIAAAVTAATKPLEAAMRASKEQVEKLQNELLDGKVDAEVVKLKAGDGKRGRIVSDELVAATKAQARSVGFEKAIAFMKSLAPEGAPLVASGVHGDADKGDVTRAEASKRLTAEADKLIASGMKSSEAFRVASNSNPALAVKAFGGNTNT